MKLSDLIRLLIGGAVVGLATYALFLALDQYVFTPALCSSAGLEERCADKESFASSFALVIGAFVGLFATVRQRVYRPLLVVLFATIGLWNIPLLVADFTWWAAALLVAAVFSFSYGAFAWIVQLRNLYVAVGFGLVLVTVLRVIITA